MNNYVLVSSIILLIFGVLWERKDWFNFFVKLLLLAVGFWGVFVYLILQGYIFKA